MKTELEPPIADDGERRYRPDNLVSTITVSGIESRTYAYDANKNVTAETVTGPLSGYGWTVPTGGRDASDRLVAWNRADGNSNRSWSLSMVGNQLTSVINGTSEARTFGNVHQPMTVGGATLQYDARGQLTEDRAGREYTWDISGLLGSVDVDGNGTDDVEYLYDALGRKIGRSESGTTRVQIQSGWRTVAEYDAAAPTIPVESFAYGPYIDEPIQKTGTGGSVYFHHDRRFSVTALSDGAGSAVERLGYSMHGTVELFDGSGSARTASIYANYQTYTGAEQDKSTKQNHLRNRWLQAELGFTSRDPLGNIEGASVYLGYFTDGKIDPLGLQTPTQVSDAGSVHSYGSGRTSRIMKGSDGTCYYNHWEPGIGFFPVEIPCPQTGNSLKGAVSTVRSATVTPDGGAWSTWGLDYSNMYVSSRYLFRAGAGWCAWINPLAPVTGPTASGANYMYSECWMEGSGPLVQEVDEKASRDGLIAIAIAQGAPLDGQWHPVVVPSSIDMFDYIPPIQLMSAGPISTPHDIRIKGVYAVRIANIAYSQLDGGIIRFRITYDIGPSKLQYHLFDCMDANGYDTLPSKWSDPNTTATRAAYDGIEAGADLVVERLPQAWFNMHVIWTEADDTVRRRYGTFDLDPANPRRNGMDRLLK